jgi:2-polyprenyl-3-methyl-5-hydroxy-6-metoxy-1,4-benzoquinol methylase
MSSAQQWHEADANRSGSVGRSRGHCRPPIDREDDTMADGQHEATSAFAPRNDEYWDRMVSVTAGDELRRRAVERSRLFDQEAERYDRCRPTYPDAVIDALLGAEPSRLEVLDVGCGTGLAARAMAARGAKVLGVELAPRMAEAARRHGIDVELAAFEEWDPAGRRFDIVTSAQAWHWLDMSAATAKAASLLRPNGTLGLMWNGGAHPDDLADALEEVYSTTVPIDTHRLFRGYGANRSSDVRSGLTGVIDAITAASEFGVATEQWYPWTQRYHRDEWLELLGSYSEYAALDANLRRRLFDAIGTTIDDYGGSFVMSFDTVLIEATRVD